MEMATSEMNTVLHRLDAMEAQNRWLKRGGLALLALVAAMIPFLANAVSAGNRLQGAQPQQVGPAISTPPAPALGNVLDVQRIVLRDANGRVHGAIGAMPDGAGLVFCDESGKERLTLGVEDGAKRCRLIFYDKSGTPTAGLVSSFDTASSVFTLLVPFPVHEFRPDDTAVSEPPLSARIYTYHPAELVASRLLSTKLANWKRH